MPTASAQAFDLGITEFITPVDGLVYPTGSYEIEFSVVNLGAGSWSNPGRKVTIYLCEFDIPECNDANDDSKWERELPSSILLRSLFTFLQNVFQMVFTLYLHFS